jgi:hypothetical protein
MARITDKPYLAACQNEDGTYSAVKAAQWLYEASTGKALSDADAVALVEKAKAEAARRRQERATDV